MLADDMYNPSVVGGIAQLGERLHGMQEVIGSSPIISTTVNNEQAEYTGMRKRPAIFGGIAQLGERLHGMQEVIGSSPIISTKKPVHKDV